MSVQDAREIFIAGIEAVQPARLISGHVSLSNDYLIAGGQRFERKKLGRVIVIGSGKASAAMAQSIERVLMPVISEGLIITKYKHSLPLQKIECREAGHPVPDLNGIEATQKMVRLVDNLNEDDLVICLVSGGASALMADAPDGISPESLQDLIRLLLASGANIDEINCIRKHLSLVKGGQLAKTIFPANLVSLVLSDVNGDDLSVIASGPTVPDPSTFSDALEILKRYKLVADVPAEIMKRLSDGVAGLVSETPKPADPVFVKTHNFLIGTNSVSLKEAVKAATQRGYHAVILNAKLEGEAAEQAARFVEACLLYDGPRPACLLMGGETTVTIKGNGLGGRNQHFALAALCELIRPGIKQVRIPVILSGGTDGTDGPTDAAGAAIDAALLNALPAGTGRALATNYLNTNDAYHFFEKYGGLIKTGPTQTNVMDMVVGLIS